jgi:exopolysaccharide production protein ExoZ
MNKEIQLLRGIAAIFVAVAHFRTVAPYNVDYEFLSMFAFGVDLFFVISGYVIATMVYKYKLIEGGLHMSSAFFLARALRILPAMWVSMLIYFCVVGFYSGIENFEFSIFLFPSSNEAYSGSSIFFLEPQWSLGFELIFYLLVSLCILKSSLKYIGIFILILILIMSFLFSYDYYISPLYYEFLAGFLAFKLRKVLINSAFNYHVLSIAFFFIFLFMGFYYRKFAGDIYHVERAIVFGTVAAILIVILNSLKEDLYSALYKILLPVSKISYSIYLIHMPVLMLFVQLKVDIPYFIALFVFLFFVLISSYVFYLLVEKPSHKLSRYVFKSYVLRGLND